MIWKRFGRKEKFRMDFLLCLAPPRPSSRSRFQRNFFIFYFFRVNSPVSKVRDKLTEVFGPTEKRLKRQDLRPKLEYDLALATAVFDPQRYHRLGLPCARDKTGCWAASPRYEFIRGSR